MPGQNSRPDAEPGRPDGEQQSKQQSRPHRGAAGIRMAAISPGARE
jgi:hypothetical protein